MTVKFFAYLLGAVLWCQTAAAKVDIRYDGIYLDHASLSQLEMIYNDYNYRDYIYMPDWQYPPIFVETLPTDFDQIKNPQKRNRLFLQMMAPLALKVNQEIELERIGILELIDAFNASHDLSAEQIKIIEEKAAKYDIFTRLKGERRYALILAQLKHKVDTVPPSILMAEAAIESNWGTNRPSKLANSLYRELVWYTDEGLEPLDETEDKNYRYKIYPNLYDSMAAHALKINAGINYEQFRTLREQARYREVPFLGRNVAHSMYFDSNLQNFAGLLDYTITFYELTNLDEAELSPLKLPQQKK